MLGRETFLAPVAWVDGWPQVDPIELSVNRRPPGPVEAVRAEPREDFDGATLDPRWVAVRQPPATISSLDGRPGWLTVHGSDATLDSPLPVLVGRRQQHEQCRASALVDEEGASEAGLCLYLDPGHHYEVGLAGEQLVVAARIGPLRSVVARAPRPPGPVVLAIETAPSRFLPDVVRLGYLDAGGRFERLAELDGRYLSTEVAGGMLGRVIGVYAIGGDAAFDWFAYDET